MSTPPTRPAPAGRPTGAVSRQPAPRPALPPTTPPQPCQPPFLPCAPPEKGVGDPREGRGYPPEGAHAPTEPRRDPPEGRRDPRKGREHPPEGIPIPSDAPARGIRGSARGKGGYRDTLLRPVLGHQRGAATLGRVAGYPFIPQSGASEGRGGARKGTGGGNTEFRDPAMPSVPESRWGICRGTGGRRGTLVRRLEHKDVQPGVFLRKFAVRGAA